MRKVLLVGRRRRRRRSIIMSTITITIWITGQVTQRSILLQRSNEYLECVRPRMDTVDRRFNRHVNLRNKDLFIKYYYAVMLLFQWSVVRVADCQRDRAEQRSGGRHLWNIIIMDMACTWHQKDYKRIAWVIFLFHCSAAAAARWHGRQAVSSF